ncbi:MAG: tetratricopeptide repeat protein [Bacteroidales bacterium]
MNRLNISVLLVFFVVLPLFSLAQKNLLLEDPDATYRKGLELFDKEKYGAAQKYFADVITHYGDADVEVRGNAAYYRAICAIELFNDDAEYLITKFLANYPENSRVNAANYQMAAFQYRQKHYEQAIEWFQKVRKHKLTDEERAAYFFRLGYSYFMEEEYDKAENAFYEIKDKDTRYTSPAIYYFAHIAYEKEHYETALQGFQRLSNDPTFSSIVPYYITQIYYLQERYDEVIDYARPILDEASAKRAPEIAKIIGDAYFKKEAFDSALVYLEKHREKSEKIRRDDHYQLGYAYYMTDQYDSAAVAFEKVTTEDDRLSQNAYFHLADSYMALGQKQKARLAFEFASKLSYDEAIKEEALLNYAIITYELYHSPFNEAIDAFHLFLDTYPNSERRDDAYNFLVMAYMYTSNYKEALHSLQQIEDKTHAIKEAYQKVAYYRGLELYNNLHYQEAVETLKQAQQYDQYNKQIAAQTHYWIAEAHFQLKAYAKAADEYHAFLLTGGAFQLEEFNLAHYNLGYAYFKQRNYAEAIQWFRKFIGFGKNEVDKKVLADAYNRTGDCYFVRRTYWQAVEYYDEAVALNTTDADYAMFQRGFALGLLKRPEKKKASMEQLLAEFPDSKYYDDALFEIGKTLMENQQEKQAKDYYERLVTEFPSSSYVKKSLVQLGLIYYNSSENQQALDYYKQVVAEYPGTNEAKNALTGIKNIYVDMNDVDSYFAYVNGLGDFADVSVAEQDSLTYIAAEKLYMKGDCEQSSQDLRKYIQRFGDGNFILSAHYYLADCLERQENKEEALTYYQFVIEKPKNTFTEQALLAAANILFEQESYAKADEYFQQLEETAELNSLLVDARVGQMRCQYLLENYNQVQTSATKVLHTEKISEGLKREAHYKRGMAFYYQKNYERALDEYRMIAEDVNSKEGAEAKYRIAQIYFFDEQYEMAENEVFDFTTQNTSQEYWLGKSFILLGDVYLAQKDDFQAKHTYKSVIDNYGNPEDDIISIAKKKYNAIVEREKYQLQEAPDTLELNMDLSGDERESFQNQESNPDSLQVETPVDGSLETEKEVD